MCDVDECEMAKLYHGTFINHDNGGSWPYFEMIHFVKFYIKVVKGKITTHDQHRDYSYLVANLHAMGKVKSAEHIYLYLCAKGIINNGI